MQKETLWKELKASAKEEDLRNKASFAAANNVNNANNTGTGVPGSSSSNALNDA